MTQAVPNKVCVVCGQDVANQRRVKDAAGHYYCEPCWAKRGQVAAEAKAPAAPPPPAEDEILLKDEAPKGGPRVDVGVVAEAAPVAAAAAGSEDDILMLKDEGAPKARGTRVAAPAAKAPAVKVAAGTAPAAAEVKLPAKCPACGLPVLTRSKYCLGCQRDLTKMDVLKKIMAEGEKEVASQKKAKLVAKMIGVVVGLAVLAILVFVFSGQIMQLMGPGSPYAEYPTQREPLLRKFLGHIAAGTEKDYAAAYKLISQRETGVGTETQGLIIANMHALRAELEKANGTDWAGKMVITIPPFDPIVGDEVMAEIKIGTNAYHIGLQVQMSDVDAMQERRVRPSLRKPHREDGKLHWGIGEVVGVPLTEGRKDFRPGCDVFDDDKPGMMLPGL